MPFRLFRREGAGDVGPATRPAPGSQPLPPGIAFDALTEDWRLLGVIQIQGRLSDALNKRESLPITAVSWAPIDESAPFTPVPGLQMVDPYDLIVVLGGHDSLPDFDEQERQAHRVHKVPYDVALDCPPFRVVGTVHLFPGTDPERLLDRQTELFLPVTDAITFAGERLIGDRSLVALVNRSYLRQIAQVDRETNEAVRPLPGRPLGGTSFGTG